MTDRHIIDNHRLSIGDAGELAEWFIYHMPMELRGKLMAERPLLYARTFPGVSQEAILAHVTAGLRAAVTVQADRAGADAAVLAEQSGHYHDPAGRFDYCDDPHCPRNAKPGSDPVADGLANLRRTLEAARALTEPDEVNDEYVRGQANLIVDTFGLFFGDGLSDEGQELVTGAITGRVTVDTALSELAALTGAEA